MARKKAGLGFEATIAPDTTSGFHRRRAEHTHGVWVQGQGGGSCVLVRSFNHRPSVLLSGMLGAESEAWCERFTIFQFQR